MTSLSERKIGFDYASLDAKILLDNDKHLVMSAVIASEIVQQYDDGWAYKPAEELEKMAEIANDIGSIPIKILEHPGADTYNLLVRQSDVHGKATNFQYVKNLIEPKSGRPMRRGVRADLDWFKDRVPPDIIEKTRSLTLRDVSIGFIHDKDMTPGEWEGSKYDYVQRNIFLNHVAAPIEVGRCPGPICGIGFDRQSITLDKIEKRGNEWCVVHCHGSKAGQAIKCFSTEEEAVKMHQAIMAGEDIEKLETADCPVCQAIKEVGLLTASKRLTVAYGADILSIIRNEEKPKPAPLVNEVDLDKDFNRVFSELKTRLDKTSS